MDVLFLSVVDRSHAHKMSANVNCKKNGAGILQSEKVIAIVRQHLNSRHVELHQFRHLPIYPHIAQRWTSEWIEFFEFINLGLKYLH